MKNKTKHKLKNGHLFSSLSFKIVALIVFLDLVKGQSQDLSLSPVTLSHQVQQNIIELQVILTSAHFKSTFSPKVIILEYGSVIISEFRRLAGDRKSILITLEVIESVKDLDIEVTIPSCCIDTDEGIVLSQNIVFSFNAGTFLYEFPNLDLSSFIQVLEGYPIFSILRAVPIHLLLFTQIQGILVLLLMDIYLPQRIYEVIRAIGSFVFEKICPWQLSSQFSPDWNQYILFSSSLLPSSTSSLHISMLGISENFFAQIIGPVVLIMILWGIWYYSKIKKYRQIQLKVINSISALHKVTFLIFCLFPLQQFRLIDTVERENVSVISVLAGVFIIAYFGIITKILYTAMSKKNLPGEDESIEDRTFIMIASSMRSFFYLPLQLDNQDYPKNQKQQTQRQMKGGGIFIQYFPLFSTLFKIWVSFVLVFFQGTGIGQIILLLISYFIYAAFTYRLCILPSKSFLILKLMQQASFFLLLIFSLANHRLIEDLIESLPSSNKSEKISSDNYTAITSIELIQLLLLAAYMLLSLLTKLRQFHSIFIANRLRLYDSQQRAYISKKQITKISKVLVEMLAHQEQTKDQQIQQTLMNQMKYSTYKRMNSSLILKQSENNNTEGIKNNIENKGKMSSQRSKSIQIIVNKTPTDQNNGIKEGYHSQFQSNQSNLQAFLQKIKTTSKCENSMNYNKQDSFCSSNSSFLNFNLDQNFKSNQEFLDQKNMEIDQSDIEDFSSIQRVLQAPLFAGIDLKKCQSDSSEIENLIKSPQKLIFLSPQLHSDIVTLIENPNLQQSLSVQEFSASEIKSFKEAKIPVSLILRTEQMKKIKNPYDQNYSFEFTNVVESLQQATILSLESKISIDTKYFKRDFTISSKNFKKFDELVNLFQSNSTQAMNISTRIFFDLEQYSINQQIQINSHPQFSLSYSRQ